MASMNLCQDWLASLVPQFPPLRNEANAPFLGQGKDYRRQSAWCLSEGCMCAQGPGACHQHGLAELGMLPSPAWILVLAVAKARSSWEAPVSTKAEPKIEKNCRGCQ